MIGPSVWLSLSALAKCVRVSQVQRIGKEVSHNEAVSDVGWLWCICFRIDCGVPRPWELPANSNGRCCCCVSSSC
ncbi:hypothetical protein QBC46DRAFT_399388 [Diplogelasinospora grovesii]|uniref:Uncharacterized protein n=1 Tax=Diplogelasinospora grovesii TaxID=303347 RepID=A0AAN6MWZ5_9PEZI|nr:hypothetical protein QBC46DRAFT_399388 [Diplogelasinospora grovesii]